MEDPGINGTITGGSRSLSDIYRLLTPLQFQYVMHRLEFRTEKEARDALNIPSSTFYNWPSYVREAVQLLQQDGIETAREQLRRQAPQAAIVLTDLLTSESDYVKLGAANSILDRIGVVHEPAPPPTTVIQINNIDQILAIAYGSTGSNHQDG